MAPPIAYDAVRLFLGPFSVTPRGIDRVELSYARFFFAQWPGECGAILPTPWGVRWYGRGRLLQALDRLEALWRETSPAEDDAMLRRIALRLAGRPVPPPRAPGRLGRVPNPAELLGLTGWTPGISARRSVPRGAVYLNVGQVGFTMPWLAAWLGRRPDVKPIFLLHDMIPLEAPHFVSRQATRLHARMVEATARHAAGLIVTTAAARQSVLSELGRHGRAAMPVAAVPLPIAPAFLTPGTPDPRLRGRDYVVVNGAIEPRKNHELLLRVWRDWGMAHGAPPPKLIVVGAPAWGGRAILERIDRCPVLREQVIVAHGLSSPALRRLVAQATAVLMPSFAEGFGLPVMEALTIGTPVVASDLPAHREVAGDLALYRDPRDEAGWRDAIRFLAEGGEKVIELRRRIAAYRPLMAPDYFRRIGDFLHQIAPG